MPSRKSRSREIGYGWPSTTNGNTASYFVAAVAKGRRPSPPGLSPRLPLIPILYLRGISSGDFQEALSALLGKDAPNLSPAVLGRLKVQWKQEFELWQQRDLSARRYVYVWADGVYLQARMEVEKQCILVLIGATPEGKKELIGFQTGFRESAQ